MQTQSVTTEESRGGQPRQGHPGPSDRRAGFGVALLGILLGWVAALWIRSLRLRVLDESGTASSNTPWILVFFHGTQVPLLAWKRRRATCVLVSWSRDGELQTRVLCRAGMIVVRGSTSRGGARGLAAMIRTLRSGRVDAAFAVDGPRGPYGHVHPGAAACARRVDGQLIPMGAASAPNRCLTRAWDQMSIPYPFAKAVVVLAPPVRTDASPSELAEAIARANARAQQLLTLG